MHGFLQSQEMLNTVLECFHINNSCIIQYSLLVYVKKNWPFGHVWKSMILVSVFVLCEENQN